MLTSSLSRIGFRLSSGMFYCLKVWYRIGNSNITKNANLLSVKTMMVSSSIEIMFVLGKSKYHIIMNTKYLPASFIIGLWTTQCNKLKLSQVSLMYILIQREYLDSKKQFLPTLPMMYLPFNLYLDSNRVSILIDAVWPTLPMMYLSFNVYLDSRD